MLTSEQVAEMLGVHVETVRRMVRRKELPTMYVGRYLRFSRAEIEAYLKRKRSMRRGGGSEA